jgi:predicted nucleotidyltransferase
MTATTKAHAPHDLLSTIVDRIVGQFDPARIILFGSRARGEARADSDVDLLVILPSVDDKRRTAIAIRRALNGLPASKDIIVTTPQEIAEKGDVIGLVFRPALREGKVIYERP